MMRVTRRQAMLGAMAAGAAQFPGGGHAQSSRVGFQWAAGGQGSVNATAALAATQVLRQTGFEMFAVNSGGTIDSLLTLARGEVDFATGDTPTLRNAWNGRNRFQQVRGFGQVLSGFTTFFFILVQRNSSIRTAADLAGKTINGHTPGAVINVWNQDFTRAMADARIVPANSIRISQIANSQAIDAMLDRRIDAQVGYTFAGKMPAFIEQAMARGLEFRVIGVPAEVNRALIERGWLPDEKPAVEEIARVDPAISNTPYFSNGITTVVVARRQVADRAVADFLTAFFRDTGRIGASHPANRVYQEGPAYGVRFLVADLPVHPGAAAFYKERGVWRTDLDSAPRE